MCDDDSFDDMVAYRLRRELLSRRGFGSLSLGAGLAALRAAGCRAADPPAAPALAAALASLLAAGCRSADPSPAPASAPTAGAQGGAVAPAAGSASAPAMS